MSQLNKWMLHGKISKLVIVITSKDTGEHVERWQFDVQIFSRTSSSTTKQSPVGASATKPLGDKENDPSEAANGNNSSSSASNPNQQQPSERSEAEIQAEIQAIFRQITASVTFLPVLDGNCTFNVLVYADADSDVPVEWGDSDAKEIKNGEKVKLRGFSTSNHRVDTLVSYRYVIHFKLRLVFFAVFSSLSAGFDHCLIDYWSTAPVVSGQERIGIWDTIHLETNVAQILTLSTPQPGG